MRLRKCEERALLEEFGQAVLRAMDRARLMGLPARRVQTVAEEAAVNWHPPVVPRGKKKQAQPLYALLPESKGPLTDYAVHMSGRVSRVVRVLASSPEAAVRMAKADVAAGPAESRALSAESVEDVTEEEDFEVFGACEVCSVPLLEGRDEGRAVDDDGTRLCGPCCDGAEGEADLTPEERAALAALCKHGIGGNGKPCTLCEEPV